ncbi:MAG: glycerate kinase [Alphaproteobacteria bacterium]|nr:glycerate kinase [Alphaproteobacteria bacterium]
MPQPRSPEALLRAMLDAALAACDPARAVPRFLPSPPRGRTIVVGAGKAAAKMARAVEDHWPGPLEGLVVTRYGHGTPCARIRVVEASHPVPDRAGEDAAAAILRSVQGLTADDLVLFLASGGGSALLALPAPGITLDDKRAVTRELLRSGATIGEINTLRKHMSAIKGGRLAAAARPAAVVTLAISDVPNDDPAVIASGPTVPDPSTYGDARAVLEKYAIVPPDAIARRLAAAADETPKEGDPAFARATFTLVATPQMALDAAAEVARAAGVAPVILGDSIEGEARDVALVHAGIARQVQRRGQPLPAPAVLLSGGETTVTVRGKGRGGRNAEFLLALAVALDGAPGIHALAVDTDGIDGTADNAGALLTPSSVARARAAGVEPRRLLADNDGYGFFAGLDDLIRTGPTLTNVNDFRAILVERA